MQNQNNEGGGGRMRRKKGQSILEYVIVLTVIVAAIALAAGTMIKPAITKAMNSVSNTINVAASKLP
jgi:uncharacterized protein (UPF0333 family)